MARDGLARSSPAIIVAAGIGAGIIGGLLMMAFMMAFTGITTGSILLPLQYLGATFQGPEALGAGAAVMFGLVVHLLNSAILGFVFAALVRPTAAPGVILGWAMLYGLVAFAVMTFLLLPWANPAMYWWLRPRMGTWLLAHAFFGLGVALVPAFMRRLEGRGALL